MYNYMVNPSNKKKHIQFHHASISLHGFSISKALVLQGLGVAAIAAPGDD